MKTTLDIDTALLNEVVKATEVASQEKAVEIALLEFLRNKQRKELSELIGNWGDFDLTLERLDRLRNEH